MRLTDLPDILMWRQPSPLLGTLQADYVTLLQTKLAALAARVDLPIDVSLDAYFADLLDALDDTERSALLCEPEVSFRLLWPGHHRDIEAAAFLADTIGGAGATVRLERIAQDGLAIDATSSLARSVDVSGTLPRRDDAGPVYPPDVLRGVLQKGRDANALIARGRPHAWTMVRDFTKLLHYLPDLESPDQFSSGSSGQFIGRSVIANAHLAKITPIEISEALVHEAIHSVLYMAERQRPWVLDPALYAGPERVASPWTGSSLPLRPYLQACFVWYGLVHYWSEMIRCRLVTDTRALARLDIALRGFAKADLLADIAPFLDRLSDEVKDAIAAMQAMLCSCLDEELCA